MSLFEPDRSAERTPLSVLTGFLGSGKTTVLNRLLGDPALADTAVIINEFGEIGLDHELVESVDGEMVLLKSGCVCCTLRSDLESAVRELLARRDSGDIPRFARIVVETTGLADPAPIVQMTLNNPLVARFCVLEGVATTVDALHAARQFAEHPVAAKQVALADRLLVTKADLLGTEAELPSDDQFATAVGAGDKATTDEATADGVTSKLQALETVLRGLNPFAPIMVLPPLHKRDRLDPFAILPRRAPSAGEQARRWLDFSPLQPDRAGRVGLRSGPDAAEADTATAAHESAHDGIDTLSLVSETPLDWMDLQQWLAQLRAHFGEQLLRAKGIVHLRDEVRPVAIHGVHHVFHPPIALDESTARSTPSRLVLIMKGAPVAEIAASFEAMRSARRQDAGTADA